jgi:Fur family transcriptional regulator, peroxide stress response regulator
VIQAVGAVATGRQRYNELVRALVRGGYRLTPQREAVLRVLADTTQHPSAEQIYEKARQRCRSTSRATIYNTVTVLKQLGEVEDLELERSAHRYGARASAEHAHLVCTRCDRIDDYDSTEFRATVAAAAAASGYRVAACRLSFYGECPACQAPLERPDQDRPED